MIGVFLFMMFGFLVVVFVMVYEVKLEKKKFVVDIMVLVVLIFFLIGIIELIEFVFLFVVLVLFVIYCLFLGLLYVIM